MADAFDLLKLVAAVAALAMIAVGLGLLGVHFFMPESFEGFRKRLAGYGMNLRLDAPGYTLIAGGIALLLATMGMLR